MDFYSARLLYIFLVADGRSKKRNLYDETVIVFRAKDHEHAFVRALEIGRSHEVGYFNDKQQRVRKTLVEVIAVDWVGRTINGMEVSSCLHNRISKKPIAANKTFHPENSQPR